MLVNLNTVSTEMLIYLFYHLLVWTVAPGYSYGTHTQLHSCSFLPDSIVMPDLLHARFLATETDSG